MTPREKADELYSKYDDLLNKDFGNPIVFDNQIKQCALIAVDEILDLNLGLSNCDENNWDVEKFYQEVKQEIENL
jgi:hypothetical protein